MEALSVFLHDVADQQIFLQLDENTTAQEVLRQITGKNQMIKEAELHEYALFIKLDAAEGLMLKERMLSSHECPLKIKKRVQLDARFKFLAKKCSNAPTPMEDSVYSDRNLSEEMIREGVLKKLSRSGQWTDRYFILDAKCIYYGKDKKSIAKAFTRIDLETVTVQEAREQAKYCFQLIIAQHNKYTLKGNNTQNKEKWMQSISNQCSIVRENREFETINQNIRKEEKKRSTNDEKLVTDCHDFEKLIKIDEGVKLLISLEEPNSQKCLRKILEYKSLKNKSQALLNAESLLNLIEDTHSLISYNDQLISSKQKKLSEIKKQKSSSNRSEVEVDLYKELFEDFIKEYVDEKRRGLTIEVIEMILDRIYELPLNVWKSKLRVVPEPIPLHK